MGSAVLRPETRSSRSGRRPTTARSVRAGSTVNLWFFDPSHCDQNGCGQNVAGGTFYVKLTEQVAPTLLQTSRGPRAPGSIFVFSTDYRRYKDATRRRCSLSSRQMHRWSRLNTIAAATGVTGSFRPTVPTPSPVGCGGGCASSKRQLRDPPTTTPYTACLRPDTSVTPGLDAG